MVQYCNRIAEKQLVVPSMQAFFSLNPEYQDNSLPKTTRAMPSATSGIVRYGYVLRPETTQRKFLKTEHTHDHKKLAFYR